MAVFVTSDTHFGHKNILTYESETRPFASVEVMDEALIQNWNAVVQYGDTVIHCGDFAMGTLNVLDRVLDRLNGHIILVRGNHDTRNRLQHLRDKWSHKVEIHDIYYKSYKGRFFIFCHFPIASKEFMDMVRQDNSEVICCYGHVHSNAIKGYVDGTYHVGIDTNKLTPIALDQIWQESWPKEIMTPEVQNYKQKHNHDCSKCVYFPLTCGQDPGFCEKYRRDPPDGGYYG